MCSCVHCIIVVLDFFKKLIVSIGHTPLENKIKSGNLSTLSYFDYVNWTHPFGKQNQKQKFKHSQLLLSTLHARYASTLLRESGML